MNSSAVLRGGAIVQSDATTVPCQALNSADSMDDIAALLRAWHKQRMEAIESKNNALLLGNYAMVLEIGAKIETLDQCINDVRVVLVEHIGSDRCQFGVDTPWQCPRPASLQTSTGYKCCAEHAPYLHGKPRDDVSPIKS